MEDIDFLIERKIIRLGNSLISKRNADLKSFGLQSSQSETILFFSSHPFSTITELKNHLDVTHQAAQKIVEVLKKKNLLEVSVSAEDARERCVSLTGEGKKICSQLKNQGANAGKNLFTNLTEEEKHALFSLLEKI